MERRPVLTAAGRVQLVENTTGKPYRFRDGSPGAPIGFGIYVGPTGAYYEVRVKRDGVTRRLALGSVQELSLADAHELDGTQRSHIRQTGEDPRAVSYTHLDVYTRQAYRFMRWTSMFL